MAPLTFSLVWKFHQLVVQGWEHICTWIAYSGTYALVELAIFWNRSYHQHPQVTQKEQSSEAPPPNQITACAASKYHHAIFGMFSKYLPCNTQILDHLRKRKSSAVSKYRILVYTLKTNPSIALFQCINQSGFAVSFILQLTGCIHNFGWLPLLEKGHSKDYKVEWNYKFCGSMPKDTEFPCLVTQGCKPLTSNKEAAVQAVVWSKTYTGCL